MEGKPLRLLRKLWEIVRNEAELVGFKWRPALIVVWVTLALLIPKYHNGEWFTNFLGWVGGEGFGRLCRANAVNVRILLDVAVPIGLILIMRERLRDYGLGLGKVKTGLKMCLLFYLLYLPCFIVLFMNSGFQEYYSFVARKYTVWSDFFVKETFFIAVLCLRTEFLYRGFLLFGIKRHYGAFAGILVQIIPYVLIHSGKAGIEAFGSLPIGLALAYLAIKTESIWYGALLHGSIALLFNALILLVHFMSQ